MRAAAYANSVPAPLDVGRVHVPTSLDHVRFIPYGRSECDRYDGAAVALSVPGRHLHAGTVCVRTPTVSGSFDVALRRFADNETLVLAKHHVVTDWPDAEIIVTDDMSDLQSVVIATPVRAHEAAVRVRIRPAALGSRSDRVVVYDETASLVAFALVDWEPLAAWAPPSSRGPSCHDVWRDGTATVRVPVAGRFNVRLCSAQLGHMLPCKSNVMLTVAAHAANAFPYASMLALKKVSLRAADIGVSFVRLVDVPDLRPESIQRRDAVVIAPYGSDMNFTTTPAIDDPDAQKFLRCHVLYGASNKFIAFDIRGLRPARYSIRYMVATPNPFVRVCASECHFDICERNDELSDAVAVSGGELLTLRDCDMHTSQQFIERLSASELAPVHHARRNTAEIASLAREGHRQQASQRAAAEAKAANATNAAATAATAAAAAVAATSQHGVVVVPGGRVYPRPDIARAPHCIEGHLLAPNTVASGELFRVAINIASGAPRSTDLIMLCTEDLTRVFTQVPMSCCMDYTRSISEGTALLYAPTTPYKCVVVYFSQLQKGVLFQSGVVKVRKGADDDAYGGGGGGGEAGKGNVLAVARRASGADESANANGATGGGGGGDVQTTAERKDMRKVFDALTRRTLARPALQQQHSMFANPPLLQSRGDATPPSSPYAPPPPRSAHPNDADASKQRHRVRDEQIRPPRMRVLLVGVSYLKQRYDLDGPPSDIAAMYTMLSTFFAGSGTADPAAAAAASFDPEKDTRVLHEHCQDPLLRPTATHIREGLAWLVTDAQPRDHLIFYFSGSGALVPRLWSGGVSMLVDQALLPCDFDLGRRCITYREIVRELFAKVGHVEDITVTAIVDAGFATHAVDVIDQRRGVDLQDAVVELGQTLLLRQRKQLFSARTRCRCVPPPEPYPLVSVARDNLSIEAPLVVDGWTGATRSFVLNGLAAAEFVPISGPCSTSYLTRDLRAHVSTLVSSEASATASDDGRGGARHGSTTPAFSSSAPPPLPRHSFFFEASRGGADGCQALDTFSRWCGASMGLFTSALVAAMQALAKERGGGAGLGGVSWFDVAERTLREARKSTGGQRQLPLLWTSARGFWDSEASPFMSAAFPLAVEREVDA